MLGAGARVVDALDAAGGARPGVDLTSLNLARVLVDGEQKAIIDGYDETTTWQVPHTFTGLSDGPHTIRVRALGLQNPLSAGTRVTSDAFIVG